MTELIGFARGFVARGWAVTVLALGSGDFADAVAALPGVEMLIDPDTPARYDRARYGRIGGYARAIGSLGGLSRRLRRLLSARRFDAMIFCEHGLVLPFAAAVAGRTRAFWLMPNIVGGGGTYPFDLNRRLYAAAFRASGMIPVANSAYTAMTLGRAGRRHQTIDLGIDPAPFVAAAGPDPLAGCVPAGAPRLLVMARLEEEKGQIGLARALFATSEYKDVHLILCGGPMGTAYEAALRAAAEAAGAVERLHLIGPVNDAARWMQWADVVASVRVDPEPFGLTIVEAMAAGKPVFAHALGGPADIVIDGETGWLVPAVAPETLAHGLSRVLADRDRWTAMGAAGRERALMRYTLATMTDQLEAVFAFAGIG